MDTPQKSLTSTIRFDPQVRPRLDSWCKAEDRSLNWATNHLVAKALDDLGWPAAGSTQADTQQLVPEE